MIVHRLGRRFRPPTIDSLVIVLGGIVGVVATFATVLALSAYLRFDDQVAATKKEGARVAVVLEQVQDERERNVRVNCEAQNARNQAAVRVAQTSIARADTRRLAVGLVDALAPTRPDCAAYARSQVQGERP